MLMSSLKVIIKENKTVLCWKARKTAKVEV